MAYANAIQIPGKPATDDPDEWLFHPIESSIAPHHRLILETAEKTITTRHGRAMLFLPPGSAKSTYGSVVVPSYCMGKWPGYRLILTCYASDLARKFGRRTRAVARQKAYRGIWNAEISTESSAADEWALTNGSEYMSGGILSGITGNRANGIMIDDPVKGRAEAESPRIRQRTLEAYHDDVKTRLLPGGWVMLIQTRWQEDDLAGALLPKNWNGESGLIRCEDGMDWNVLCIPAKCDRGDDPLGRKIGEYLWPEWFDAQHWAQFEINPRTWSALYQQKPTPETGIYFQKEWFQYFKGIPTPDWAEKKGLRIYGASDYATKDGEGDFTVHIVVGIDRADNIYVLDIWRGQTESDIWVERFCDLVILWKPHTWGEPQDQIEKSVGPFLRKRMLARRAFCHREQISEKGDKRSKARSFQAIAAMKKVFLPETAPWMPALLNELLVFDAGKNDDQVDALSVIGRLIDKMLGGKLTREPEKKRDVWDDAFEEAEDEESSSDGVGWKGK